MSHQYVSELSSFSDIIVILETCINRKNDLLDNQIKGYYFYYCDSATLAGFGSYVHVSNLVIGSTIVYYRRNVQ